MIFSLNLAIFVNGRVQSKICFSLCPTAVYKMIKSISNIPSILQILQTKYLENNKIKYSVMKYVPITNIRSVSKYLKYLRKLLYQ